MAYKIAAIARGAQGGIDSYFPVWAKRLEKEAAQLREAKRGQEQRRQRELQGSRKPRTESLHVTSLVSDAIDSTNRVDSGDKGEGTEERPSETSSISEKEEQKPETPNIAQQEKPEGPPSPSLGFTESLKMVCSFPFSFILFNYNLDSLRTYKNVYQFFLPG